MTLRKHFVARHGVQFQLEDSPRYRQRNPVAHNQELQLSTSLYSRLTKHDMHYMCRLQPIGRRVYGHNVFICNSGMWAGQNTENQLLFCFGWSPPRNWQHLNLVDFQICQQVVDQSLPSVLLTLLAHCHKWCWPAPFICLKGCVRARFCKALLFTAWSRELWAEGRDLGSSSTHASQQAGSSQP